MNMTPSIPSFVTTFIERPRIQRGTARYEMTVPRFSNIATELARLIKPEDFAADIASCGGSVHGVPLEAGARGKLRLLAPDPELERLLADFDVVVGPHPGIDEIPDMVLGPVQMSRAVIDIANAIPAARGVIYAPGVGGGDTEEIAAEGIYFFGDFGDEARGEKVVSSRHLVASSIPGIMALYGHRVQIVLPAAAARAFTMRAVKLQALALHDERGAEFARSLKASVAKLKAGFLRRGEHPAPV